MLMANDAEWERQKHSTLTDVLVKMELKLKSSMSKWIEALMPKWTAAGLLLRI